jgi:hypothetical protein
VKKSSRDVTDLGRSLDDTKKSLRDLGIEYQRTGKVEIERYRNLTGELKKLEQAKRDLDKLGGNNQNGLLGGLLGKGLGAASGGTGEFAGLSSKMSSSLVYGAVAAAPAIAATLNAAVLGALGAAVLAGGILVAAKDPKVKAAWSDFADSGKQALSVQASVLVDPLVRALGTLKTAMLADVIPTFGAGLDRLSPSIDHLSLGVAGFAHNIGPGLLDALGGSEKVLSELGDDLPRLGSGFGYALRELSKGADGAKDALGDVVTVIDGVTRATGFAIGKLSQLYALSHDIPGLGGAIQSLTALSQQGELHKSFQYLNTDAGITAQSLDGLSAAAARAGLGAKLSAADYGILTGALAQTKLTTDQFAGSLVDQALSATLGLDQATLGLAQAQSQLGDVLVHNHSLQDISTAKGQELRQAVLSVVAANKQEYDTTLAVTGSATDAAAAWDRGTASLEAQLRKAHLTQGEIDALIGKYRAVPDRVDTNIATNGLTAAINGLADLLRQINNIPSYKTITVNTNYTRSGEYNQQVPLAARAQARGGIVSYARGGVEDYKMSLRTDYTARSGLLKPSDPGTILAGEPSTGGEAFIPRKGISDARGLALADTAAGWHGGRVVSSMASWASARPITAASMGGGGTIRIELESAPIPLTLDGRKIGELLINDAYNCGGTAMTTFIRRVASR